MIRERGQHVLDSSTLVLNRFYLPIHVVTVRRSMVLLYRDLAEVVDVDEGQYWNYDIDAWREISEFQLEDPERLAAEDWLQCIDFAIRAPRVIRLLRYDGVPKMTLRFNRRNLFARDDHSCQYCGVNLAPQNLSMDHVHPRSRGGKTSWSNVVCCCLKCNTRKGNRTPTEAGMKLKRQPDKPKNHPLLKSRLRNPKYDCWRPFLPSQSRSAEAG